MTKLKNITANSVSLQMFNTVNPQVNLGSVDVVLNLQPGEVVTEANWLVSDVNDLSYNAEIIDTYINKGILTRIK